MRQERIDVDLSAVGRVCAKRREIDAAYVYGSYARGRPNRHSDLDVAVFVRAGRAGRLRLPPDYELALAAAINGATGHPRVEVVVLNEAPPLLAWEAVRKGRRLFGRAPAVIAHETRARQRYLDTAPLRAIQDRYLDEIVRRGFSRAARP